MRGQISLQNRGQLRLTGALVRETEELDHQFAGAALGKLFAQVIEHIAIRLAWPELISIHQIQQCHGFASQRVDDVAIIDHMTVFSVAATPAAYQAQHSRAAEEQLHSIIEQMRPQPMPDQARRHEPGDERHNYGRPGA